MGRDVGALHPLIRPLCLRHVELAWMRYGIRLRVIETDRDSAVGQLAAWLKGRNAAGKIVDRAKVVTWKRPGDSWHNLTFANGAPCSLAYHVAPDIPNGRLLGFGSSKLDAVAIAIYKAVGILGESLGLRWGGNWDEDLNLMERGEDDLGHFEHHPGFTMAQARAAFAAGQDLDVLMGRPG
jgi:hypothetical protein